MCSLMPRLLHRPTPHQMSSCRVFLSVVTKGVPTYRPLLKSGVPNLISPLLFTDSGRQAFGDPYPDRGSSRPCPPYPVSPPSACMRSLCQSAHLRLLFSAIIHLISSPSPPTRAWLLQLGGCRSAQQAAKLLLIYILHIGVCTTHLGLV